MAHSDGLITAPVCIYDIQQTLGIDGGGKLGTLCRASQINKFAKWKPFRNQSVHYNSDAARETAAKTVNFGTGIVSCGRLTFKDSYQSQWTHLAPRGENGGGGGYDEFYRTEDFKGYQHHKWQLGETADGRAFNTIFNGYLSIPGTMVSDLDIISFNMQCRENNDLDAYLGMLYPYDLQNAQKDISGYYVGLAILDSADGVWIFSEPHISDFFVGTNLYTGVRTQISNSIPNGALKIAPVLTQNKQDNWSSNYNGDIIILNGAFLSANKVAQTANVQTSVTFELSSSRIRLNFRIKNETGNSVTINNMVCYLLSNAAFDNEHDNGYSGPDYQGEGAVPYIMRTWPQNYKQGDIMSHDWSGGSTNPDQLAARYYNAYSDFYTANGNTNLLANNADITWYKDINYIQDDFGSYANGAWALLCLAPTGNSFVREYKSF